MIEKYQNYQHLYTDGSKQENLAGAGAWTKYGQIMARLPGETSILTCELYAILMGIIFTKMQGVPIAVLSDSLSAIQTIKAYYKSKNSLTQKIIDEVSQYNQEIVFIFIYLFIYFCFVFVNERVICCSEHFGFRRGVAGFIFCGFLAKCKCSIQCFYDKCL